MTEARLGGKIWVAMKGYMLSREGREGESDDVEGRKSVDRREGKKDED